MEVAGIVLAILPLCITALEHHGSVARGFKAWFNYQANYARFAGELGLRLVELEQSIKRVLRAAEISDDEQTDAMIKSCGVEFWRNTDQEIKLKAHFGEEQYKLGFAFILRNIKEAILDICRNFDGLQDLVSSSENDLWAKIMKATQRFEQITPNARQSLPLKKKAKFVMARIQIRSAMQRLECNISDLSRQAANTERRALAPQVEPTSIAHFLEISMYAQRLHTCLKNTLACGKHGDHCVQLRLEQKLKSSNTTLFKLALAQDVVASKWYTFGIDVPKSQGPGASSNTGTPRARLTDICTIIEQSQQRTTSTYIFFDDRGQVFKQDSCNGGFLSLQAVIEQRSSLKSLLRKASKASARKPLWSSEQSVAMGLTIISSFLQLATTKWVPDLLSSNDVFLLPSNTPVDTGRLYLSANFPHRSSTATHHAKTLVQDHRPKVLRLGIILFEICLLQTAESCRQPGSVLADDWMTDWCTAQLYLRDHCGTMPVFFQNAIRFCLEVWNKQAKDVNLDGTTRHEIHTQMLIPFQKEVRRISFL